MLSTKEILSSNVITAELLLRLNAIYQPAILLFRLNVIVARASRGAVRSAPNGAADIMGTIQGRAVAIEVKAGRDRLRPAQENFRDQWTRAGGVYVVARDVEQAITEIQGHLRGY